MRDPSFKKLIEQGLPALVLLFIFTFSVARFFVDPYIGFYYNTFKKEVVQVYVPDGAVAVGDILLQVGDVSAADFDAKKSTSFFQGAKAGDIIPITVLRNGEEVSFHWQLPGPNRGEIFFHLSLTWFPYVLWIIGTITLIFVRPRDDRWIMLSLFNYVNAMWAAAGIAALPGRAWYSHYFMNALIWLCIPIYLHLHWIFPRSLGRLPKWLMASLYAFAGIMIVAEVFDLITIHVMYLSFLVSISCSLVLILAHGIFQPSVRKEILLIGLAFFITFLPVLFTTSGGFQQNVPGLARFSVVTIPIIPSAYFYIIYRKQFGGLEVRVNKAITSLLFASLLFLFGAIFVSILGLYNLTESTLMVLGIVVFLFVGLVSTFLYPWFKSLVERYILGVPLPPKRLLENYGNRITASLTQESLANLLLNEVFPAFLIRQGSLIRLQEQAEIVLKVGLDEKDFGECEQLTNWLLSFQDHRNPVSFPRENQQLPWLKLLIPLVIEDRLIGVCLLGRRDPDDYYHPSDIQILNGLMQQTALALLNIDQATRLRSLYQADIDRQENDRSMLAVELHDEVLGQMAVLQINLDQSQVSQEFANALKLATDRMRTIVNGLRPLMLNYGLRYALDEMVDEAHDIYGVEIMLDVDDQTLGQDYPELVKLHLYRIIQQAYKHAVEEGEATIIRMKGVLKRDEIDLVLEDNGPKRREVHNNDLTSLLAEQKYTLASMHERAALIGARLLIFNRENASSMVHLRWSAKPEPPNS